MKNNIASILLISCLISIISLSTHASDNKPTLIIFSADWCYYCKKAENDMINNQSLSETIKKYDIVKADFDLDKVLVEGYNIKTIPSFITIHGNVVNKYEGYFGVKELIKFLK